MHANNIQDIDSDFLIQPTCLDVLYDLLPTKGRQRELERDSVGKVTDTIDDLT